MGRRPDRVKIGTVHNGASWRRIVAFRQVGEYATTTNLEQRDRYSAESIRWYPPAIYPMLLFHRWASARLKFQFWSPIRVQNEPGRHSHLDSWSRCARGEITFALVAAVRL